MLKFEHIPAGAGVFPSLESCASLSVLVFLLVALMVAVLVALVPVPILCGCYFGTFGTDECRHGKGCGLVLLTAYKTRNLAGIRDSTSPWSVVLSLGRT
ncbi:MAG: hypothetical protein IBX50_18525 [Marinospirillum sp.]|uniref:hypothetical protein n=1 Tax=Marinospirillum sp. TaxID=2183934 RepID=UPI0019EBE818|nr:hypothetical protein [Marinospirillum sp.]MBE0508683.1 hypothetical protein [Marinospirillum sp.]